ncbi:hypothetical protein EI42_02475 [Thermosporothrix hazakensis]|jgi:hypothetical protein|uniref:Uncharacterized protein n=2 Tax=Thermosporothrix TaxID=768650 RepID=A0A326UL96_THEHA|nr:hypothetical protein [Thermosporothrix hazakensis]PZW30504.1 hypothetical protein EI42_02475 [Thermosporothrix hazakensis]BBH91218.1 hypothetical protein KTC_59690 [Thermosporothrix sp. COM3]GCE49364.1 hypothetical protein KTH_42330 [Thermosporothrix hazakensis]
MGGNSFELLMQSIIQQQKVMEALEAENRELRLQIQELKEGRGVYIDICGTRFALRVDTLTPQATAPLTEYNVTPVVSEETQQPQAQETGKDEGNEQKKESSFLEEIMIDEFAAQTTSPMSVWKGSAQKQPINEEEKAALRRELSGSFILE